MPAPELQAKVAQWLQWDRDAVTRAEIESLVEKDETAKLSELLLHRMEFGTAGLRAAMGAGNSRMNELTVIQAAQGLAAYLKDVIPADTLTSKGIIVGYDARHKSARFARLTANVMLAAGIPTRLFRQITPTPFVPFGVLLYGCVAGVMVTASHNPKQDNGYKVYWGNGAQIIPPHDSGIADAIASNLEPRESSWTHQDGAVDPYDEVYAEYFRTLASEVRCSAIPAEQRRLRFVYTAMHGVGTDFTLKSLEVFGFDRAANVALVTEQCTPDPEFPTVAFPNPEEGKSSLDLSIKLADATGCRVILANDPDADRLAIAEKQPGGAWRIFNGNQIGALLGWWQLRAAKLPGAPPLDKNTYLISSAVSSKILAAMAARDGLSFEETLTGFKWMGSRAEQLRREGKRVIFAFEEAIGFMIGERVFDKDGVTAAGAAAEMATWLDVTQSGKTLSQQLEDIYAEYGYHTTYNSYMISRDPAKTTAMFQTMRTLNGGDYPAIVAGAKVTWIRDLSVGFDSATADRKALLPSSAASPMITFTFDNGVILTIRGSGTEPKVKWYSEMVTATPPAEGVVTDFVDRAVVELMRPEQFGFSKRPTS